MTREKLINKVKQLAESYGEDWFEMEIFDFADTNVYSSFRDYIEDNNELSSSLSDFDYENYTIIDYFSVSTDKTEDELIELFVDFILTNDEYEDEFEENIQNLLEDDLLEEEEDDDYDYYDEDDSRLKKEDRYDDYDFYDEF